MDICDIGPTEEEKHRVLSSLGVDSLLSTELLQELQVQLGVSVARGHETVSDLAYKQLEDIGTSKTSTEYSSGSNNGRQLDHSLNSQHPGNRPGHRINRR